MTLTRNSHPGMLYMSAAIFFVLLAAGGGAMAEEALWQDGAWRPVGGGNSISCYVVNEDAFVCHSSCPAGLISAEYTDGRGVGVGVGKVCCIAEDLADSPDPSACQIEIELTLDKPENFETVDGLVWIKSSGRVSIPSTDAGGDVVEGPGGDVDP